MLKFETHIFISNKSSNDANGRTCLYNVQYRVHIGNTYPMLVKFFLGISIKVHMGHISKS